MKVDRRTFLSFGMGAAAGTALTPLPWKLIDDMSIWTQNWPWTPVPLEGKVTYENSTCTLCPGGCGITVRKIANRVVKIEGRKNHPVNNGGICMLGLCGPQLLYSPTRIKGPMKRIGQRGEGKWQNISWEQAISELSSKLKSLRDNKKTHKLASITDSDKSIRTSLINRFVNAFGSPNTINLTSSDDIYSKVISLMQGDNGCCSYDFENSDFIISFGCGLLDGWGSPVRMFQVHSKLKNSCSNNIQIVQVEPRLSNTASKSDLWLAANPGTEAAIAMAISHYLIKENLYDDSFIRRETKNFDAFKELVLYQYSPEKVAEITGVKVNKILTAAKAFAKAKNPIAVYGRGKGDLSGSLHDYMAVHCLNALKGSINKQGGIWTVPEKNYIKWPEIKKDDIAIAGLNNKRIDSVTEKSILKSIPEKFIENISASKENLIEILLISESNPCHSLLNTKEVTKAFNKIPYIVSFSSFMDETSLQSDLVLPNHLYLERYDDAQTPKGFQKPITGLVKPVIEPLYNTKNTGDVIISLAKELEGTVLESIPWDNYLSCLKETLNNMWKPLKDNGYYIDENYRPSNRFYTASRRFEFNTKYGLGQFSYIEPEGDIKNYPLTLIPCETIRLASGYIGDSPFMLKTLDDTVLKGNDLLIEINPETAKKLGLNKCQKITLQTPKGEVKVGINIYNGIRPGVIGIPKGLGHSAYDEYLSGKGINYNTLAGPVEDKISGINACWGTRARIVT